MTDYSTRVLSQTVALGDSPDDVRYEIHEGHAFLMVGPIAVALPASSQAAIDKLAVVAAQAAADSRARHLREVA